MTSILAKKAQFISKPGGELASLVSRCENSKERPPTRYREGDPMENYSFADWQSGKKPPKGWDCADAIDDGWGKPELDAYMRATVMSVDDWREWARKEYPEAFKDTSKPKPVAQKPAGQTSQDVIRQLRPAEQAAPQSATVTQLHTRKTVKADDSWEIELVTNLEGNKIKPNVTKNWALYLENHHEMAGVLGYNEFAGRVALVSRPPWDKGAGEWTPRSITDVDISRIVEWLEAVPRFMTPKFSNVVPVIERVARGRSFHPVRDYLDGLPAWDGVPRLNFWLETYAGIEATPLTQAFARKVLCAAVRRVRLPGCKFDHVLVLNGPENLGKSRLIRALCPNEKWFGISYASAPMPRRSSNSRRASG
jgi:hypothetical protein